MKSGYITKDQLERAKQYSVLEYILTHEQNNIKRVGKDYRMKDHESLAVSEKGFYWHSHNISGKTALNYLTDVRNYGLVEAVCMILGERSYEQGERKNNDSSVKTVMPKPAPNVDERIPFKLPLRNKDNRRVIAYLQSRGIDRDLILACINQGLLYESLPYHHAVFLGKNETGKTRFAAIRGTASNFKSNADGSDIRFGFVLPPDDPDSHTAAVFESAINCLSHQTLCKEGYLPPFNGWRLALSGTSLSALEHFLETHRKITHCIVCTDNDEAGEKAAAKIADMPGITTERSIPIIGDWNDMLQSLQKEARTKNRLSINRNCR